MKFYRSNKLPKVIEKDTKITCFRCRSKIGVFAYDLDKHAMLNLAGIEFDKAHPHEIEEHLRCKKCSCAVFRFYWPNGEVWKFYSFGDMGVVK